MTLYEEDKSYITNNFHKIFTWSAEPHFLIMSHEFHVHVGCTVSISDKAMPYQPFRNFYTKMGGGGGGEGHDTRQLRPESYSYTVASLHRRSNFQQNKGEARLLCHLALFFKKGPFL